MYNGKYIKINKIYKNTLKTIKLFVDDQLAEYNKKKNKKSKNRTKNNNENNNVDEDNVTIGDILNSSVNTGTGIMSKDKDDNNDSNDNNSILSNLSLSDINSQDSQNSGDSLLSME
jgi:hypothetical protein